MVIDRVTVRPGAAGGRLEVGQGATGVAAGEPDQLVQGVVVDRHRPGQAALVGQAAGHDLANRVVRQRLERQQQRARQERRDDGEERVLGRGGDQRHPTVLDAGQQRVLLRLAEAVHLVDEQHGLASAAAQLLAGRVDDLPHLLDTRRDRGDLHEASVGLRRDDARRWSSCRCRAGPTA